VSTPALVAAERASDKVFLAPAILLAALVAWIAVRLVRRQRRRTLVVPR
jgi:hypothetical protein